MEKTLDEYLLHYGPELGRKVLTHMRPLHRPSVDAAMEMDLLRKPFPMQAHAITAAVQQLDRSPAVQIVGECGVGKGGLPWWPVLTPDGWSTFGQLKAGDHVIGKNGQATKVLGVFRRGVQPCYEVAFTDGTFMICDADHLWNVKSPNDKYRNRPWRTMSTKDLAASKLTYGSQESKTWHIPMCDPVELPRKSQAIPPYVMGVLLGDGCLKFKSVTWSKNDPEVANLVLSDLNSSDYKVGHSPCDNSGDTWRIIWRDGLEENPIRKELNRLGLWGKGSHEKFVPLEYAMGDVNQRLLLLQGLMDTDGYAGGNTPEFCSTSKNLADCVAWLCESLGGTASITLKESPRYTHNGEERFGRNAWRVLLSLPPGVNPFRTPCKALKFKSPSRAHGRWIKSITQVESAETICIKVAAEDGLFLTNNCIVTHNTLIGMATAHAHARGRGYRTLVMCPPHLVEKHLRETQDTIPHASTTNVRSIADILWLMDAGKPEHPEFYVISSSVAKLGPGWTPIMATSAGIKRSRATETFSICHHCRGIQYKDAECKTEAPPDWHTKNRRFCCHCGTAMFQWGGPGKFTRWPVSNFIHKKLKGKFDYFIPDEVHQTKSDESQIGEAMGTLCASAKKTITLTGTLIGGYSEHVRAILFRSNPQSLLRHGFAWEKEGEFVSEFGRYEIKETVTEKTNRKGQTAFSTKRTKRVRPGIMPTLYGQMLIDSTVFLSLSDVAQNLPELTEITVPVEMSPKLRDAYNFLEAKIKEVVNKCLAEGNAKPIPVMLQTLMGYTDRPYGWGKITYAGDEPGQRIPICTAPDLSEFDEFPKETELLGILRDNKARGRQCWIFTTMTGVRDVCERLQEKIESAGLRCGILRAEKVPTKDRERWIAENGPRYDVIISHPKPVETGLDLFDKSGGHNFATLIFYLTGYDTFVMRQASRRAYRLGQPLPCETYYMFYKDTLQETAMSLMGQKLAASLALEGNFSSEGLIAMIGDDSGSMAMELAKSLSRGLSDVDVSKSWSRIAIPVAKAAAPKVEAPPPAKLIGVGDQLAAARQTKLF